MNLELVKDVASQNDDLILKLQPILIPVLILWVIIGILSLVLVRRFTAGKASMKKDGMVGLLLILSVIFLFFLVIKKDLPVSKAILHPAHSQRVATYEGYIDKKDIDIKEVNTTKFSKEVVYIDNQAIPKNDKDVITVKDINFDIKKTDKVKVIAKVEYAYKKGNEKSKKQINLRNLEESGPKTFQKYTERLKSVKLEPVK